MASKTNVTARRNRIAKTTYLDAQGHPVTPVMVNRKMFWQCEKNCPREKKWVTREVVGGSDEA